MRCFSFWESDALGGSWVSCEDGDGGGEDDRRAEKWVNNRVCDDRLPPVNGDCRALRRAMGSMGVMRGASVLNSGKRGKNRLIIAVSNRQGLRCPETRFQEL